MSISQQRLEAVSHSGFLSSLVIPLGVFSLSLLWLGPFAFLDFDTHHDGYMLAQVLGLRDGLSMHRDIAGQYGPLTAWSQLAFMFLPLGEALNLRVWTVFHLSTTAFLVADLARVWPSSWKLPKSLFPAAAILWILSSDIPADGYMLPWSSVHAAFLVTLALYLALGAAKFAQRGPLVATSLPFFAGVAIGILPFARINVGLALWGLLGAFVAILVGTRRFPVGLSISGFLGFFSGVSTVVAFLVVDKGWGSYFSQAVIRPLEWATNAVGPEQFDTLSEIVGIAGSLLPASVVTALTLVVIQRAAKKGVNDWTTRQVGLFVGIAAGVLGSVALGADVIYSSLSTTIFSLEGARSVAVDFVFSSQQRFVYFLAVLSLLAWSLRTLREIFRSLSEGKISTPLLPRFLVGLFSLALLVQIVPTHDPRHMWWGSVLAPLVLLGSVWGIVPTSRFFWSTVASFLATQVLLALLASGANLVFPRFDAPADSVSRGLLVKLDDLNRIKDSESIGRNLGPGVSALFVTRDAFVAVSDGTYRASSEHFVWWTDPYRSLSEVSADEKAIIYQDQAIRNLDLLEAKDVFAELGFGVVECWGEFCLFEKS
jgi:hypothetical protein